jgi:NADPH:quinone reductase-like Zn-dependent oxidoreductase
MSVVEQPTLQPGPGSAVIRILSAAVLTYAWKVYSGKKPYPYREPFIPGSSGVGRIAAVGLDATRLKPGQLVYFDCYVHG